MKYNHALFLNPYIESGTTSSMGLFPPTGLEYVATSAKDCVNKLTLLDLRCEESLSNTDRLLDFIKREIDIICVSIGWDRQLEEISSLLNQMPDKIPLVIGGYKATELVDELFKKCPTIDIIIRGEGEETIKEILNDTPLRNILGISYRINGNVVHNTNRPLPNVDIIGAPDRSLRRDQYHMILNGVKVANFTFDTVLSSRGCPYNCKFCTFNLNPLGQKRNYSERTLETVISEIEGITANIILFSDDNFSTNPKRAEELCDLIIERKIRKRFLAQARIDIARYPILLEKMAKAGFKMLFLGLESPHDHILLELNKGFDSNTIRKSFTTLNRYPIFYHGYFIYGNIGETEEEMFYISDFSKEIGVDSIGFSKLRIDKFSQLRELAEKTPGYHVTEKGELYSDAYDHPALKKIGKRIKFSFYTPYRLVRIAIKFLRVRFFTLGDVWSLIIALPLLLKNILAREIQKDRLIDSLKRIFVKNI